MKRLGILVFAAVIIASMFAGMAYAQTILRCTDGAGVAPPVDPATDISTPIPDTYCRNNCPTGNECVVVNTPLELCVCQPIMVSLNTCRQPQSMMMGQYNANTDTEIRPGEYCRDDCPSGEQCVVDPLSSTPCACMPVFPDQIFACTGQMMYPPPAQPTDIPTGIPGSYCRNNCPPGDTCVVNNLNPTNPCECQSPAPDQVFACDGQMMYPPPHDVNDLPTAYPGTYCRNNCPAGEQCIVTNIDPNNPCTCGPIVQDQVFACDGQMMYPPPHDVNDLLTAYPGTYCRNNCPAGVQCLVTNIDPNNPCTCSNIQQTSIVSCNQQTMTLGVPLPSDLPTSDPSVYCRNDCMPGYTCEVDLNSPTPSCNCAPPALLSTIVSCASKTSAQGNVIPSDILMPNTANSYCRNDCPAGYTCKVRVSNSADECYCETVINPGSGPGGSGGSSGNTGSGGGELPEGKNCTSWAQATVKEKKTVTESDANLSKIRTCAYTTYVRYCMSGSQIDFSIKDEYSEVECSKWADKGSVPEGNDCQYRQAGSVTEKEQTGQNCRECVLTSSEYYCKDTQTTYPAKKKTERKCGEWSACPGAAVPRGDDKPAQGSEQIDPLIIAIPIAVILVAGAIFVFFVTKGSKKEQ